MDVDLVGVGFVEGAFVEGGLVQNPAEEYCTKLAKATRADKSKNKKLSVSSLDFWARKACDGAEC